MQAMVFVRCEEAFLETYMLTENKATAGTDAIRMHSTLLQFPPTSRQEMRHHIIYLLVMGCRKDLSTRYVCIKCIQRFEYDTDEIHSATQDFALATAMENYCMENINLVSAHSDVASCFDTPQYLPVQYAADMFSTRCSQVLPTS